MSGRIRSIKPELIEDAVTAGLTDMAFRMFIACILLADDYGNLRFEPAWLKGQVFWARDVSIVDFSAALAELDVLVLPYVVKGQRYGAIRNWEKHQKVSHPGKPRVPRPPDTLEKPSGDSPEDLVPDLRSPITDPDHEGDLPRAHASDADAFETETFDNARSVTPDDGPPSLDAPIPEMWLVQAKAIVRDRCVDVDPESSWRCYVLRVNEPKHREPASLARYLRWVIDDCSNASVRVGAQLRRDWSGPRLRFGRQLPLDAAPFHAPAKPPPQTHPDDVVGPEEREALLRAAGLT